MRFKIVHVNWNCKYWFKFTIGIFNFCFVLFCHVVWMSMQVMQSLSSFWLFRDIPRAVYISFTIVIIQYVLVNISYFLVLTPAQFLSSNAVAIVSIETRFEKTNEILIVFDSGVFFKIIQKMLLFITKLKRKCF